MTKLKEQSSDSDVEVLKDFDQTFLLSILYNNLHAQCTYHDLSGLKCNAEYKSYINDNHNYYGTSLDVYIIEGVQQLSGLAKKVTYW